MKFLLSIIYLVLLIGNTHAQGLDLITNYELGITRIVSAGFINENQFYVKENENNSLQIRNLDTNEIEHEFPAEVFALCNTYKLLAIGHENRITIYDTNDFAIVNAMNLQIENLTDIAFNDECDQIVTAKQLDVEIVQIDFYDLDNNQNINSILLDLSFVKEIYIMKNNLLMIGSGSFITYWDVEHDEQVKTIEAPPRSPFKFDYTKDESKLLINGRRFSSLINVENTEVIETFSFTTIPAVVSSVQFSLDDHNALLGLSNGFLVIYDIKQNNIKEIFAKQIHDFGIESLDFSDDGTQLLTLGDENIVKLWRYTQTSSALGCGIYR